jgi:hypothetical protein
VVFAHAGGLGSFTRQKLWPTFIWLHMANGRAAEKRSWFASRYEDAKSCEVQEKFLKCPRRVARCTLPPLQEHSSRERRPLCLPGNVVVESAQSGVAVPLRKDRLHDLTAFGSKHTSTLGAL